MITPGRHRPLAQEAWNESAVRVAIEEIAADAIAHFHPDIFWPAHPSDDGVGDGDPSFYKGAAGVIWALVPHHSDYDWLIFNQSRMGKSSGATRIWMLRATPG
jgi:hypothetical protein